MLLRVEHPEPTGRVVNDLSHVVRASSSATSKLIRLFTGNFVPGRRGGDEAQQCWGIGYVKIGHDLRADRTRKAPQLAKNIKKINNLASRCAAVPKVQYRLAQAVGATWQLPHGKTVRLRFSLWSS